MHNKRLNAMRVFRPVDKIDLRPNFHAWRHESHTKPRTALSPNRQTV